MTYEQREAIFSKEVLTIDDVMELTGKSRNTASVLIRQWKRQITKKNGAVRIDVEGTIHVLDYFEVMRIDTQNPGSRYTKRKKFDDFGDAGASPRKSICI